MMASVVSCKRTLNKITVCALLIISTGVGKVAHGEAVCRESFSLSVDLELPIALDFIATSARKLGKGELGVSRQEMGVLLEKNSEFSWIRTKILTNDVSFAMNRNVARRQGILKDGFLNQHQVYSSGGEYNPSMRVRMEAAYSSMSARAYKEVPSSDRPKYGYLAPRLGGGLTRNRTSQGYGADTYIFKLDRLSHRTTWVPGDSLDQFYQRAGEGSGKVSVPRGSRFLPWADRDLLLPYLRNTEGETELSLHDMGYNRIKMGNETIRLSTEPMQDYVELQYWGKLTLDDVQSFIFKDIPPQGEFLRALQQRKIEIFQAIGDKDIPWVP